MKKKNIFITAALSVLLGLGVTAGIGAKFASRPSIDAKADSLYVTGTRVYIEDQTGSSWTSDGRDAIMHVYNVSFVSGSGYSSLADVKLNDLYATSFATDGSTYLNIRMKWKSGSHRQYEAILPWYIQSFKTEFYATHDNHDKYLVWNGGETKINYTCNKNSAKRVYITYVHGWGSGDNHSVYVSTSDQTDSGYTYEFNGIKSGSHMYLRTTNQTGWEAANAKFGICFGKSNINQGQSWSSQYNTDHSGLIAAFCWKVQGSGDSHLYECIVPQYNGQDVYWSMVIGVRFDPVASSPGWSNNWNQTGDQFYNGDDKNCNVLSVTAMSGGGLIKTDEIISDDTRAGYYGTYFLSQITCSGSGSITSPSTNWTNVKNEYKQHLSTAVEGIVWTTAAAITGTDLVRAIYRYDYIVSYKGYSGYDNFINRNVSVGRNYTMIFGSLNAKDASNIVVIVIVSVTSLAALGGYFFLRKKKQK